MQASSLGSIAGLRVIDLSRVLGGPYCTQILADHGADVIKVEPPGGDETRTWGPPFRGDTAAYFDGVNRNKRGIVLDLSQEAGRETLLRLLEDADVLVENFKIGTLERWHLGYQQALSVRFPRLIHCRISGFGAEGPMGALPGYDAAIQAMCGLMSVNGEAGGEALRVGVPVVDMATGLNAALGIMMALHERSVSGRGQFVESTLFDCALSLLHPHAANYLATGREPARTGNAHPNITPYDKFGTGGNDVFLAVGNNAQFAALCDAIERPELAADPRYASNSQRALHRVALRAALEAAFAQWDGQALADSLIRRGVPCAPVLSLGEALGHPHALHRQMQVSLADYQGVASPIKMSRTPAVYRRAPPRLDEHAGEILDGAQ